jgi:hypothetical protein
MDWNYEALYKREVESAVDGTELMLEGTTKARRRKAGREVVLVDVEAA